MGNRRDLPSGGPLGSLLACVAHPQNDDPLAAYPIGDAVGGIVMRQNVAGWFYPLTAPAVRPVTK